MKKEVTIYTFTTCPYCIKAKNLLKEEGVDYKEFDITGQREKLKELEAKTNCDSVPQIFVDGKFIGGCDDVVSLHKKGEFDKIFKS